MNTCSKESHASNEGRFFVFVLSLAPDRSRAVAFMLNSSDVSSRDTISPSASSSTLLWVASCVVLSCEMGGWVWMGAENKSV